MGIFLENNYKIQTIWLVRKRFKHIWFLTIRVQRSRFLCYKIEYIVLELPVLPEAKVGSGCPRRPEIEFNELGFWACKPSSLNSVCKPRIRVHWTRFQGLQTESKELGLYAQKPSSLNSVCKPRNRVQRTRFHLSPPVGHQTLKKFLNKKHRVSKYTVSLSFPLTLGLSLTL